MLYKFDGKAPTIGQGTYVSDIARVIGDVVIGRALLVFVAELRCWTPQKYSEWMHPAER